MEYVSVSWRKERPDNKGRFRDSLIRVDLSQYMGPQTACSERGNEPGNFLTA
jgi:hypothetical protein